MENNLPETISWTIAAIVGTGMVGVLILGWLKGNNWQRELKKK